MFTCGLFHFMLQVVQESLALYCGLSPLFVAPIHEIADVDRQICAMGRVEANLGVEYTHFAPFGHLEHRHHVGEIS